MAATSLIRPFAQEIIDRVADHRTYDAIAEAVTEPLRRLAAIEGLHEHGVFRKGNHTPDAKWLYYDGGLHISLDSFPKGKRVPTHDHGVWEAMAIYTGAFEHTVYKRTDDGSKEGHAQLEPIEERTLRPGEVTVLVPPDDIHGFTALEDNTYFLTVVGGRYSPRRKYYNLDTNSYIYAAPKNVA